MKKILAVILAIMMLGCILVAALAEDTQPENGGNTEDLIETIADVPAEEEPAAEEPAVEEPAEEEPAAEEPAVEEPAEEEPAAEEPAVEEPAEEEPAAEEPAVEEPAEEEPAAEEPAVEEPAEEEPAAEEPAVEEPVEEEPVQEIVPEQTSVQDEAEPIQEAAEEPNDASEPVQFTGRIIAELKNTDDIKIGDQIVLQATVSDTNMAYTFEWQRLLKEDLDTEREVWSKVSTEEKFAFDATDAADDYFYRAVLTAEDGTALVSGKISFAVKPVEENLPIEEEEAQAEELPAEEPVAEEEPAEEPAAEEPVAEEVPAEEPVVEEVPAEEPVVEEVPAEEPAAVEPAAEEVPAEEPAAVEPAAEEVPAEEPVAEEPVVEEVPAEEPAAVEPAAEEVSAEEPAAEEPAVEEVPAEEPAAEEPVVEEVPAEEPVTEEKAAEEAPVTEIPGEETELPVNEETIFGEDDEDQDEPAGEDLLIEEETVEIEDYETALGLQQIETLYTVESADVRVDADGLSPIFATLDKGEEVKAVGQVGRWTRVVIDNQVGFIFSDSLADSLPEETEAVAEKPIEEVEAAEEELAEEPEVVAAEPARELNVFVFSSRRTVMAEGDYVALTSKLEGFDGLEVIYQWECDKGDGFQNVDNANEDSYFFRASAETLSWNWRLTVYYR